MTRIDDDATPDGETVTPAEAAHPVGAGSESGGRRWLAPMLVAAAGVLVVGVIVAVTTRGSGGQQPVNPAAPGIGGDAGDGAAAIPEGQTVGGLVFAHHPDQGAAMDALLEGIVTDSGGCLTIAPEWDEAAVTVPSFPLPGTEPTTLNVGDRVALGGGFVSARPVGEGFVIPDQCKEVADRTDGYFLATSLTVLQPAAPAPRFGPEGPNGPHGPYVATYADSPDGNWLDALFEGTLTVRDGCVVAEPRHDDDGLPVVTPVFPQSQIEPAEPPAILHFHGREYRDGDPIDLGGAMYPTESEGLPTGCPAQAWGVSPDE